MGVSLDEITAYFRKEFYGEQLNKVELADLQTTETDLDQMAREDAKEFLEDLDSNKDNFLSVEELASQYSVPDESDNDSSDSEDSDDFQEYLRDFEDRSEYDDSEDKSEYDDGTDDNDDGTDDNEYESEFIEDSYKEEQYPGEEDAAAEALTAFKAPYTDEAESADNTDEADSADNTDGADSTGQY